MKTIIKCIIYYFKRKKQLSYDYPALKDENNRVHNYYIVA